MIRWLTLTADVITGRVLAWTATWGRDAELSDEAHIYFFDRYRRLADYHRARGHHARAAHLRAKAEEHWRPGAGPDGPPYAAAMAMPRPARWLRTDAVGHHHVDGPDDAA